MRVLCVRLVSQVDGTPMTTSPWVKLDGEYPVLSVLTEPAGRVLLQILTEEDSTAARFDSSMFMTTDPSLPPNWIARIGEDGSLDLAPQRWLVPGFWDAFHDDDPVARSTYGEELSVILGSNP